MWTQGVEAGGGESALAHGLEARGVGGDGPRAVATQHTSSAESSQMPVSVHTSAVQVPFTVAQALSLVADESEQVPHSD